MTDEPFAWEPQFQADGEAWRKIVLKTDDLASRISGYASAADLLLGEIIRYGTFNDSKMIRDIEDLYDHFLSIGVSVQMRREVYRHVAGFQQNTSFVSANAYLPFIACEPDRGICSTAVIDYVSMAPSRPAHPISSVQDIIGMISARFPRNVGAAFGGLLYLGDRRVCRLLWPLKEELDDAEANEASLCFTGFLSAATTEFQIDWLEGMDGDGRDALFGVVASGLALQRRSTRLPFVATGERPFPVKSVSSEEQARMQQWVPIEDYTARIAPRLFALERTEPEPKVMPDVLAIWEVSPRRASSYLPDA